MLFRPVGCSAHPCDQNIKTFWLSNYFALSAFLHDSLVLLVEAILVDLLPVDELRIAWRDDLDLLHHLPDDDSDVLVVDGDALEAVDLLHLVHEEALAILLAEDAHDVVRVPVAVAGDVSLDGIAARGRIMKCILSAQ